MVSAALWLVLPGTSIVLVLGGALQIWRSSSPARRSKPAQASSREEIATFQGLLEHEYVAGAGCSSHASCKNAEGALQWREPLLISRYHGAIVFPSGGLPKWRETEPAVIG